MKFIIFIRAFLVIWFIATATYYSVQDVGLVLKFLFILAACIWSLNLGSALMANSLDHDLSK